MDAYDHARRLIAEGDVTQLIDVVMSHWTEFLMPGDHVLGELMSELSDDVRQRHPELTVLAAATMTAHRPHTMLTTTRAKHALELIRARRGPHADPRALMRTIGLEFAAHRVLSNAPAAAEVAERWERVVDELPPQSLLDSMDLVQVLTMQAMLAYVQDARFADAIRIGEKAVGDENPWRRLQVDSLTAMSQAFAGDFRGARAVLARYETAPPEIDWRAHVHAIGWHIASALVAVEDGRADEAMASIDEIEWRHTHADHGALALVARARAVLRSSAPGEAADHIQEVMTDHEARRMSPGVTAMLTAAQADLLIASGQFDRAQGVLGAEVSHGPIALAQARLLLRTDALAARRRAITAMNESPLTPWGRSEALMVRAIAAHRLELADEADAMIDRLAVGFQRRQGLSILALGPRNELVALTAQRHPAIAAYVRSLPPETGIATPVSLTASELKVLRALPGETSVSALAGRLFISQNTVKTHLRSLYRKLGVTNRSGAIAEATRRHLFD